MQFLAFSPCVIIEKDVFTPNDLAKSSDVDGGSTFVNCTQCLLGTCLSILGPAAVLPTPALVTAIHELDISEASNLTPFIARAFSQIYRTARRAP